MKFGISSQKKAVAIPVLILTLAFSGCSRSPEARSAKYIESGKKLLEKNDPTRAVLEFRSAAQVTPANPEVYHQMGIAYVAAGDIPKGVAGFRKALELNPKHTGAQLALARLMSATNDPAMWKEAEQHLQALLQETPDSPNALHALALTEFKQGHHEDAIRHFELAMATAPQGLIIAINLAQAKLLQKDPKGAEDVLRKVCENSPKSADAVVILGKFYSALNRVTDAEQQYQRALTIDPKHVIALHDLATLQNRIGRKQEAEQNLKRLSGLSDKTFKHAHASFLFQEGRRNEAVKEFEKLAMEDPNDRLARTRLIAAYQAVNRLPEAQEVLNNALKKNPKDLDAILQRGEIYLDAGKYERAQADFNDVVRLKPDSAEVHYALAKLHLARGATLQYRQELSEALRFNPLVPEIRLELAQALFAADGNRGAAAGLDLLDSAPADQRELTPVIVQRNWILWSQQNFEEMRKGVDRGLLRDRSTDLLLQDGLWKLHAGNLSEARAALEEALKVDLTNLRALAALNQTYMSQKQSGLALQKVKEYVAKQPKSAPAQEFLGLLLLASGDRAGAREAFTAAKAADPHYVKADFSLVQLDVLEGKSDDGGSKLKALLANDAGNWTAHLWMGDVEAAKGNQSAALDHFRKVVENNPQNGPALNNLAYLLTEHAKRPDEALQYAERALELAPENPTYADTLGWVLYQKGLYRGAIKHLEQAASKKGNVTWKYHLAMAYAKAGDLPSAQSTLKMALNMNPNVPEAEAASRLVRSIK